MAWCRGSVCCCFMICYFLIFSIIITSIVVTLVLFPSGVKIYVESASLTQFDLIDRNTTLQYNLTLGISARNPNKKSGMCYNKIRVAAFYKRKRFGRVPLSRFCQGHKNTSLINPVFVGQSVLKLIDSKVVEYHREKADGFFYVDVEVNARIRNKVGSFKTGIVSPDINCKLRLPIVSNSSSTGGFTRTQCRVHYPDPESG